MSSIALLAIGSEILDGRIQDSNSNYLCAELNRLGYEVEHIISCLDDTAKISEVLKFAFEKHDIVLLSGGLGPTGDDLTREAVGEFFNLELSLNQRALDAIKEIYKKRNRKYDSYNEKQALLPAGSIMIDNPIGTAPGFYLIKQDSNKQKKLLAALPGVPTELKAMYRETLLPLLLKEFSYVKTTNIKALKCFGLPEAFIGAKIKELNFPDSITVSYRAAFPEVHVLLKSANTELESYCKAAKSAIGNAFIFSQDLNMRYEEVVQNILLQKKLSISAAESCSGGLLSSLLTNTSGSSACFLGSVICYSNEIKKSVLGVEANLLDEFGAVSSEAACSMARNCRSIMNSDIAVSITGIAGPEGGSKEKPVGLFYAALAGANETKCVRGFLPYDRKRVRIYAAHMGLDLIRRHLMDLPPMPDASLPLQNDL